MDINKRFFSEADELLDIALFRAFHNAEHIEKMHIDKSLGYLIRRGDRMPRNKQGGLLPTSAFYGSLKEYLPYIRECILLPWNLEALEQWDGVGTKPLVMDINHPIGFGVVQEAPHGRRYEFSAINVVLSKSRMGRTFFVATAYPDLSLDDIDAVNEDVYPEP